MEFQRNCTETWCIIYLWRIKLLLLAHIVEETSVIRQIIKIDEEKCTGCGLCVTACHEGAIAMINGKAQLIRDDYCDGLGNCLPACPTGAITFEQREALPYDEAAVMANMAATQVNQAQAKEAQTHHAEAAKLTIAKPVHGGSGCACPGSKMATISRPNTTSSEPTATSSAPVSQLRQWPVQIKLVPVHAPYFEGANLLIAADCCAFAYGNFHQEFIRNRITLVGCPKLDDVDYTEKLTAILANNNINSLTVTRMEVPCCGGIEHAAKRALQASGKFIPWQVVTISTDGRIVE